jgi:hypothetical protein
MGLLLMEGRRREEKEDGQPGGHGVFVCIERQSREGAREGGLLVSPCYCSRCSGLTFSEGYDFLNIWLTNFCDCTRLQEHGREKEQPGQVQAAVVKRKEIDAPVAIRKSRDKSNAEWRDKEGDMAKGSQE